MIKLSSRSIHESQLVYLLETRPNIELQLKTDFGIKTIKHVIYLNGKTLKRWDKKYPGHSVRQDLGYQAIRSRLSGTGLGLPAVLDVAFFLKDWLYEMRWAST